MRYSRLFFALLFLANGHALISQTVSWSAPASPFQVATGTKDGKIIFLSTYANTGIGSQMDTIRYADLNGNTIWKKILPGELRITALTPASDEGFFVCGHYYGSFQFNGHQFSPGAHRYNLWIAKCASDGSFTWVKEASATGGCFPTDISCRSGSLAIC